MRFLIRAVPTVCAVLVAAASFALSYVALRDVAARTAAVPEHLAWLTPICVDGAVLAGSASLWASSMRRTKKDPVAVLTVVSLLVISVVINVSHAGPSPLAKIIAALPPLTLLACLELVAGQYRREADAEAAQSESQSQSQSQWSGVVATADVTVPAARVEPAVSAPTGPDRPVGADVTATPLPQPAQPQAFTTVPVSTEPAEPAGPAVPGVPVRPAALDAVALAEEAADATVAACDVEPAVPVSALGAPEVSTTAATPAQKAVASELEAPASTVRPEPTPESTPESTPDPTPEPRPAVKARPAAGGGRSADASTADRVRDLFVAHLASGGAATDPSLARAFSTELGVSPAHVRRILGPLRLELDTAA